ncbi:MAG: right-handed parallel beta-helix repeat-containing protein [Thermodesulfobacteriota bacterium]
MMITRRHLLLVALLLGWPGHVHATEYYVDTSSLGGSCSDANSGTQEAPWCTLGRANSQVGPGDTAFIRQGTYHETIQPVRSGESDRPITFMSFNGEAACITGVYGSKRGYAASLENRRHIVLDSISFDGRDPNGNSYSHVGIYLNNSQYVVIRNCTIANFQKYDNSVGYGIWAREDVNYLGIDGCSVHHNGTEDANKQNGANIHIFGKPGGIMGNIVIKDSESYNSWTEDGLQIGMRGLVTDVLIENSEFHGNKEDGIDMKEVERVTVRNCDLWGHQVSPTGGGAGIVIHKGARDVLVEQSRSHGNDYGFTIQYNSNGTSRSTERITVQQSDIYENRLFGIHVAGGYWAGPMEGMLRDIYLYNNTIYDNSTGVWLFAHQAGDVTSVVLRNNISWLNEASDFSVHSDRIKDLDTDFNDFPGASVERTLYWHDGLRTLGEFQAVSGQEAHSLAEDPLFRDPAAAGFSLQEDSPAIDRGTDVGLEFNGSAPDLGAHETSLRL